MPKVVLRNSVEINYQCHGDGAPLLLISGTGHDLTFWSGQVPRFERDFRVIVFDNRGVGESSVPASGYTLADMADDAAGVLAAEGIGRAHVMGFSMGGHIAQELALNHPDRVASLGIHHSWTRVHTRLALFQAARKRLAEIGDREALVDISLLALFSSSYFDARGEEMVARRQWYIDNSPSNSGWAGQLAACLDGDTYERLPQIAVPTLVTASTLDILASPDYAAEIHARIAGAELVILEGTGHVALIERPDEFATICHDFLSRVAAAEV